MYIDPSAGSLVLQAAVATGLSGIALVVRMRGTVRTAVRDALSSVLSRRPTP